MSMKKIFVILSILVMILTGCEETSSPSATDTVNGHHEVDLSAFGVTSDRIVGADGRMLLDAIDNRSSGVFLLSNSTCEYCLIAMPLITEVADELGVNVYYIDTESSTYPFNAYAIDIIEALYDHLEVDDQGVKTIYTPHLFSIVSGKVSKSHIGLLGHVYDSDRDDERLKDIYRDILNDIGR